MTISEVRAFCYKTAKEYGFNISCYPIVENKRLKTTLGQVRFQKDILDIAQIEFSSIYINTATDECVKHTILHELAHVFVFLETNERHGHDDEFKSMCARLGLEDEKSYSAVQYKENMKPTAKYHIFCNECGKLIGRRHRLCPVVKNPEEYTSSCCGAKIKVVANW